VTTPKEIVLEEYRGFTIKVIGDNLLIAKKGKTVGGAIDLETARKIIDSVISKGWDVEWN